MEVERLGSMQQAPSELEGRLNPTHTIHIKWRTNERGKEDEESEGLTELDSASLGAEGWWLTTLQRSLEDHALPQRRTHAC